MNDFDVIIIGSGLSGLLCGYTLSKEGRSVCILEKQHVPGGNLQTFQRHGKKFETGVHYIGALGEGQTLNRYWKYFGLADSVPRHQLNPDAFDMIGFRDAEFPIAQGYENFIARLLRYFPVGYQTLTGYLDRIAEVVSAFPLYKLEVPAEHREHHYTTQSARDFYHSLAGNSSGIPLAAILAGNNYIYGGNPVTPLHVSSLINHSFISGAYRVTGGSDLIAQRLVASVESMGGMVMTRQEVKKILPSVNGFHLETAAGEQFRSRLLISSIHPAKTLAIMPPDAVRPAYQRRITSLENTASSFILYLSMKPGAFPYLNHNYYFHKTADPWCESSITGSGWPGMFLLTTGCHREQQQYAETVTVLTYMSYNDVAAWKNTLTGHRGALYEEFKLQMADRLMNLVEERFPGIRMAVEHTDISTPLTYRDYTGIPEGSLYGIRKNYHNPLLTTVMPKTKIPHFYFTGQNTNLHGVLGVTISSVVTCGEILGLEYLLKKIRND